MKNKEAGARHLTPVAREAIASVLGKALFIVGPSAVGKSAVACELASRVNGEIVSCDAMQVYREVRIASDRPPEEMLSAVAHHLIGVVSVEEAFSVARYRELALGAIQDILKRKKVPVICGGSGMYMMALLDGLFEGVLPAPEIRIALEAEADGGGLQAMYQRLKEIDAEAVLKIKPADRMRIVRALEIFEATGKPISVLQKERDGLWGKMDIRIFGLNRPREELYARAEKRVERMFQDGLVEEVRTVLEKKLTLTTARFIGIPEVKGYLHGGYDPARAKYLMKLNTRHYIKRQLTWFRKDKRLEWMDVAQDETFEEVAGKILGLLLVK